MRNSAFSCAHSGINHSIFLIEKINVLTVTLLLEGIWTVPIHFYFIDDFIHKVRNVYNASTVKVLCNHNHPC
jgi:hypothetical protein